ncbi:YdeI/OmpD-associated family protein [Rothia sp. ARF10]|nr:YdeI/OmpD-associated family protein [Rothia sp. ARF10]
MPSADPAAAQAFEAMAYSHRKEYVRWVTDARRERTRADRVAKTVEMVREGLTR